jgi:hypothetical protein
VIKILSTLGPDSLNRETVQTLAEKGVVDAVVVIAKQSSLP